jgi:Peptidase family M49
MLPLLASSALSLLAASASPVPGLTELARLEAQYAPVELRVDVSGLPESERQALARLVQAARLMDAVFLEQTWAGNGSLLLALSGASTPLGRAQLRYFLINRGPWDMLDHNRPFLPGVPEKPEGANFYPPGATKEQVASWEASLTPEQRARASGFFTTVVASPDGTFTVVPYSEAYQGELALAAALLRDAARLTTQPTLKAFLEKRADAFLSNDYYASDVAWMELDSSIEPTIGPYEVYEDGWFNAKAAFEAFITVRDEAASAKLARFSAQLQALENALPLEDRYKNAKLGTLAPIRVVNSLFCSGDGNHGVQTAAFNLPNDERVVKEMGSKRVMLKNVQEAKYQRTLLPIAKVVLTAAAQPKVSFDAFFTHILMHELMHGLGPHNIQVGTRATTVRQELQGSYSALEEAKADISGLWALQQLVDKGVVDKSMEQSMYVTYLASAFRSLRFGLADAHGKGVALQVNWLLDQGAYQTGPDGRFSVVPAKIQAAVRSLTQEILSIQATGDGPRARALLQRMGVIRPEVQRMLEKLVHLPVDIAPRFTTAEQLTAQFP